MFIIYSILEAYSREQTQIVQKIVSEHNGSDFVFAEEPEAKKELWKVHWLLDCCNYLLSVTFVFRSEFVPHILFFDFFFFQ